MTEIVINDQVARKVLKTVDAGLCSGVGIPEPGKMCVEAAVCYALGLPHGDKPTCVAPALRSLKIALNDSQWSSKEARTKGLRRLALIQLGSKDVLDEVEFAKRVSEATIRITVSRALCAAAKVHPREQYKLALRAAAERCFKEGTKDAADAAYAAVRAAYAAAADAADAAADAADAAADAAYAAADAAYAAADAAYAAVRAARAAVRAARAAVRAARAAAYAARAAVRAARAAAYAAYAAADAELTGFAEMIVQILVEMKVPGCQWLYLTEA